MQIPTEKALPIIIDLLITTLSELQAIRDFVSLDYADRTNIDPEKFEQDYRSSFNESQKALLVQLKAHYVLDFDVDEYLKGLS